MDKNVILLKIRLAVANLKELTKEIERLSSIYHLDEDGVRVIIDEIYSSAIKLKELREELNGNMQDTQSEWSNINDLDDLGNIVGRYSYYCLRNFKLACQENNINTIHDLLKIKPVEFLQFRHIGPMTVEAIMGVLEMYNVEWEGAEQYKKESRIYYRNKFRVNREIEEMELARILSKSVVDKKVQRGMNKGSKGIR